MYHRSTRQVVEDLRRHGRLIQVDEPLSPHLEIAEVQRRVYQRGGPAILFNQPLGSSFPMVSNLFGTLDQARFLFRHTLDSVRRAIELKIDPTAFWKQPWRYHQAPWVAWRMQPRKVARAEVMRHRLPLSQLPALVSWPNDGGAFVTLPQVLSQSVQQADGRSFRGCNLGMYRIQLCGNEYEKEREIGLHYQIHRGIGVHHSEAIRLNRPFHVNVSVGGSPAMTLSAVMPLPEGMSELTFAGALAGHRIPLHCAPGHAPIYADADFCIVGEVDPTGMKPEGPFGDHLGYYSLTHDFPFMKVKEVYHRPGAIWPFTVVGRPPQEDTTFGELIHEITGPIIPTVIPGVRAVHAVDASGVHPLLLAIGSERYDAYRRSDRPQELLTQANAILGQGQMSLAKYLFIVDEAAQPNLDIHDIQAYMQVILERVDWRRDLHFQTETTIDTLDYSGQGFNRGSKLVIAASGPKKRTLLHDRSQLPQLPSQFHAPQFCMPGVLVIETKSSLDVDAEQLASELERTWPSELLSQGLALIAVVDDAEFCAKTLNNWLWVFFTRSNPAVDVAGIDSFTRNKHWGCHGPLVIDARRKKHHAPMLIEDPKVTAKIDALAAKGGPLARYL